MTHDWTTLLDCSDRVDPQKVKEQREARNRALKEAFPTVQLSSNNWSRELQQATINFRLMPGSLLHLEALADALRALVPYIKADASGDRSFNLNYSDEHRYGGVTLYLNRDNIWCMKRRTSYYRVSSPDYMNEDLNIVLQWTFWELHDNPRK